MTTVVQLHCVRSMQQTLLSLEDKQGGEHVNVLTDIFLRILLMQGFLGSSTLQNAFAKEDLLALDKKVDSFIEKALVRGFDRSFVQMFHLACFSGVQQKIEPFLKSLRIGDEDVLLEGLKRVLHQGFNHLIGLLLKAPIALREEDWIGMVMQELRAGNKDAFEKLLSFFFLPDERRKPSLYQKVAECVDKDNITLRAAWGGEDPLEVEKMDALAFNLAAGFGSAKVVLWYLARKMVSTELTSIGLNIALKFGRSKVVGAFMHEKDLFSPRILMSMLSQLQSCGDVRTIEEILVAFPFILAEFQDTIGTDISLLLEVAQRQPYIFFYANPQASQYSLLEEAFTKNFRENPEFFLSQKVHDEHAENADAESFEPWQALRLLSGLQVEEGGDELDGVGESHALTIGAQITKILQEPWSTSCTSDILAKAFTTASTPSIARAETYFRDYSAMIPAIILTGNRHHYSTVVLYKEHMVLCDRNGVGPGGPFVIYYRIDPNFVSVAVIDKIMLCVNAVEEHASDLFLSKLLPEFLRHSSMSLSAEDLQLKNEVEKAFANMKVLKAANCNIAAWKKGLHLAQFLLFIEDKKKMPLTLRVKEAGQQAKRVADECSYKLRSAAFLSILQQGFTLGIGHRNHENIKGKISTALAGFFKAMKKKSSFISLNSELQEIEQAAAEYKALALQEGPAHEAYLQLEQALLSAKARLG